MMASAASAPCANQGRAAAALASLCACGALADVALTSERFALSRVRGVAWTQLAKRRSGISRPGMFASTPRHSQPESPSPLKTHGCGLRSSSICSRLNGTQAEVTLVLFLQPVAPAALNLSCWLRISQSWVSLPCQAAG